MDEMVLQTQEWLNETYGGKHGYNTVEENGKTGWQTIYGLTRALQIELGISEPADNFGPTTQKLFKPLKRQAPDSEPNNMNYILQGALWCKGFSPCAFTGVFFEQTENAVKKFQKAAGLTTQDGVVTALIMKALLDMSAFRLVPGGNSRVRQIQQNLNRDYNDYIGLMPCDGLYARDTNKALIYALQKEEGMSTSVANGFFGNGTTNLCPTLTPGDSRTGFVLIVQYALYCNGKSFDPGEFDGKYGVGVVSAVKAFQEFMCLPQTGYADMPTIKALLSSSGDTTRTASACDTATILTAETAQTLRNNGYKIVGRYLTGNVRTSSGLASKALTAKELSTIFDAGLKVFPIYQDGGYESSYFVKDQGTRDAYSAASAARRLGFPSGTTIYFAVDFDAYDYEVTDKIIPYFQEIKSAFAKMQTFSTAPKYEIGVYGPRNICIRTAEAELTKYSFVANMSTGFSGNLGYPMPDNWAFDQFYEGTIGSGSGSIGIDKDGFSGRDSGVSDVNPPSDPIYDARLRTLTDILSTIPALEDLSGLANSMFEFDTTETIYASPVLDIILSTSLLATIPSEGSPNTITVTNGKPGAYITGLLGDTQTSLTASQIDSYQNLLNSLSLSVRNGYLEVYVNPTAQSLNIQLKIYTPDIPVGDSITTGLTTTITFKIKQKHFRLPDSEEEVYTPNWDTIVNNMMLAGTGIIIVVGIGALVFLAPEAGAVAVLFRSLLAAFR
ncbi:YbfG [Bacillus atrophaeus UCMB-5137]|uniref:glycoside hydrolase domain-containing protein n=1 Tax=Bacillus atrophaeus TaxID=1452 RepID=UPI00032FCAA1|nr:glycoside hydrolase domain-containing protein [Bacillus atrophaeus]AKL85326.1 YbfG [Bacillus atrophaeus UCMB-5137]